LHAQKDKVVKKKLTAEVVEAEIDEDENKRRRAEQEEEVLVREVYEYWRGTGEVDLLYLKIS